MPSGAALKSATGFARAELLRVGRFANDSTPNRQILYHASLALNVAAWDAYLNDIISEFFFLVSNPIQQPFGAMTTLTRQFADRAVKKFNTPNFDNSRELLMSCTGYDPYADWTWPQKSLSVLQVKELLNQILKVRHSFAHGFAMPTFSWTQSNSGKVRLTNASVAHTAALLRHLIVCTDRGLSAHISATY
jgi:hypothetical protein